MLFLVSNDSPLPQDRGREEPILYKSPTRDDSGRVSVSSPEDAICLLLNDLQGAAELFAQGHNSGRDGAIAAQSAVVEFLMRFQNTNHLRQPLVAVLNALVSLEDGAPLPLLVPRKRKAGRRPSSPANQCDKGLAVATVTRLQECGIDKKGACGMVAKVCRDAGLKPERSGARAGSTPNISGRTVSGWLEKIDQDICRGSLAGQTLDRVLNSRSSTKDTRRLLEGLRVSLEKST